MLQCLDIFSTKILSIVCNIVYVFLNVSEENIRGFRSAGHAFGELLQDTFDASTKPSF